MYQRFCQILSRQTSGESLGVLRISFGLVMALTAWSMLRSPRGPSPLRYYFVEPAYHFTYPGFSWIRPLGETGMTAVCVCVGVCGLLLTVGLLSRCAAAGITVLWTYVFLLDETIYNNHYYLQSLIAFLLIWMPSGRCYGLDGWLQRRPADPSETPHRLVGFWCLFLLRAQLFIVYFYGGIAKLNADYLLHAQPLKSMMEDSVLQNLGPWAVSAPMAFVLSYCGMLFDLLIGPLLLVRRTRILGIVLFVIFHALNHFVLFRDIALYPFLGLTATTIFLEPDWPSRLLAWMPAPRIPKPDLRWSLFGALAVPGIGITLGWRSEPTAPFRNLVRPHKRIPALALGWVVVQAAVPLRHALIAGPVGWTEEGGRFSWRMKASVKSGTNLLIRVEDSQRVPDSTPIYREVDCRRLDWADLPEWMIVYEPLIGQRIIFNRLAGRAAAPLGYASTLHRARAFWTERVVGRVDATLTISLTEALEEVEGKLAETRQSGPLVGRLRLARALAKTQNESQPAGIDRLKGAILLRSHLAHLIADQRFGSYVTAQLERIHPFATVDGTASPQARTAAVVSVPSIMLRAEGGRRIVNRKALAPLWESQPWTWVDFSGFDIADWVRFPAEAPLLDRHGRSGTLWNPYRDLGWLQVRRMVTQPFLCRQYARRVADLWQRRYGRTPGVFFFCEVAMNHHRAAPLIDPAVDLASAPVSYVKPNPWILPPPE